MQRFIAMLFHFARQIDAQILQERAPFPCLALLACELTSGYANLGIVNSFAFTNASTQFWTPTEYV